MSIHTILPAGTHRWMLLLLVAFGLSACGQSKPLKDRRVASAPESENDPGYGPEVSLLESVISQGVPKEAAQKAFDYFDKNQKSIKNQTYMTIIDFTQHSTVPRWYLINLEDGNVDKLLVSHGRYSDLDHDGYATDFSNVVGSGQSSLGFYLTAERYYGKHGLSMRMDGLEGTNSNARRRAIVVHGADYVSPNRNPIGRSLGCPAVEQHLVSDLIDHIEGGSLFFIYFK